MMHPPFNAGITFTQPSQWVWHVSRDGKRVGTVSGDSVDGFTARDINHRSIGRGFVSAQAAMQAWVSPPLNAGITFTRPSQWVWRVSLDGKRVGTVYGDAVVGFTARDIDFHLIGRGYVSDEAAMQACVPVMSSVTSLQPVDGRASRRTA